MAGSNETTEQRRARRFRYIAADPERYKRQVKAACKRNKEKRTAYMAEWRKRNREHYLAGKRRNQAKRRATQKGVSTDDPAVIEAWHNSWRHKKWIKCHWCGKRISPADAHIDHVIPVSKGGSHCVSNLTAACSFCNVSKSASMPDEFNKRIESPRLFI